MIRLIFSFSPVVNLLLVLSHICRCHSTTSFSLIPLTFGVPQGSILESILFNLNTIPLSSLIITAIILILLLVQPLVIDCIMHNILVRFKCNVFRTFSTFISHHRYLFADSHNSVRTAVSLQFFDVNFALSAVVRWIICVHCYCNYACLSGL